MLLCNRRIVKRGVTEVRLREMDGRRTAEYEVHV